MPHHSWIEIEKIIFFLCLLFMAMVYRLIWFQKNIIQLDFSTVNENNLSLSRIWIACQRETYFFEFSEFYFWIHALKYMKQKHMSRHTPKFTWRLFFLLLGNCFKRAPCLKINLRSMKGKNCAKNIWHTLLSAVDFQYINTNRCY